MSGSTFPVMRYFRYGNKKSGIANACMNSSCTANGLRPDISAGSIWLEPVKRSKREREVRSRIISTFFISAHLWSRVRSLRLIAFIPSALPKRRMARSPESRYFSHSPHRNAIVHELPKIKELKCTLSL